MGRAQAQRGFQSGEPGGVHSQAGKRKAAPREPKCALRICKKEPEEHPGSPEKEPTDATAGEATVASVGGSRFTMDSRAKSLGRVQSQAAKPKAAPREPTGDCFLEPDLVCTDIHILYFHVHLHVRNPTQETDLTREPDLGNPTLCRYVCACARKDPKSEIPA